MKLYKIISLFTIGAALFSSCAEDDGPSADDNFLNFEIPEVTVTDEFPVGVYYLNPGNNGQDATRYKRLYDPYELDNKKIGPYLDLEFGNYGINQDVNQITDEMVGIIQQHVDWCIAGGVDFLILPALRAEKNKLAPVCVNADDRFYNLVRGINSSAVKGSGKKVDMKSLKFVATVNMEDPISQNKWEVYKPDGSLDGDKKTTTLSNTVLLEDNNDLVAYIDGKGYTRTDMFKEFYKSISEFFKDEHYYRVGGRPMVVLQNAHKLYSKDCKAFYDAMRQAVKEYCGEDMYIVAQQDSWSPPARFEYFFKGVDAVTHKNMYNQGTWDRSLFYPQTIFLNWQYSREYFRDNWGGTEYIPTGAVAFYGYVDNGNYDKPIVDFNGDTFRTMCQVMKNQVSQNRIVFIDSFNQIQYSSFLEPTKKEYGNGFGTLFLDIVKEQFDR